MKPLLTLRTGGQTGVDRAVLDVALRCGVPVGGWCPRGRRAEDGPLPGRYPLQETPSDDYAQRTDWNVRDSEATLILARLPLTGGTALTAARAKAWGRPYRVVDPADLVQAEAVWAWLHAHRLQVLNVAGPRETTVPGSYAAAKRFLERMLGRKCGGMERLA
ncbi:MAG: putative molybdenum carrier protein [Bacteroidota bacterium]